MELKLGFLYEQSSLNWLLESWSQFKLAIQDVNEDPTLLPGHVLNYSLADTEGLELSALRGAGDLIDEGVVGIVGTGYSRALMAPAVFCSMMGKPMVSPGSTAVDLTGKTRFPFLLRSIAGDSGPLKTLAVVSYELGWRRAAVLVNEDFVTGYSQVLMPAMQSLGLQHLHFAYKTPNSIDRKEMLADILELIANSGYRIIMLYPKGVDMVDMDVLSKSKGLRSGSFYWVMMQNGNVKEWRASTHVLVVKTQEAGGNSLRAAFQARWPNVSTPYSESKYGSFNRTTKLPFYGKAAYSSTIWDTHGDGLPDYWGTFVYDTVYLFAKALHAMNESGDDLTDGTLLRERLLQIRHFGITGEITFDRHTQDRTQPMEMILFQGTGQLPYVIARTTKQISESSPSDSGWCRSGCTDLTNANLAAIPWPSGKVPSDGRDLDPGQSQSYVAPDFLEGRAIQIDIKAHDSSGGVPCAKTCAGGSSVQECRDCQQTLVNYDQLTAEARDAAGCLLQPTRMWQLTFDETSGLADLVLHGGLGADWKKDDTVYISVLHRGRHLIGSPHAVLIHITLEEHITLEDHTRAVIIVLSVVSSLVVLIGVAYAIRNMRKVWIQRARENERLKKMAEQHEQMIEERITKACAATKSCMFNVCFIKYTNFKKAGRLLMHEHHREEGNLVSFDTYELVLEWVQRFSTIFISHQWLGFTDPDPDNIHFPAICSACEAVCSTSGLSEDALYVWVDYISIPQSNAYLKQLSIASLPVYASVVKYFVVVAPKCIHHDKRAECNSATYQRRGWCRLEQWARMTVGGLRNMYLYDGDGTLQSLEDKQSWYTESIKVFEGDFTVDADKDTLVDPVMGLWYMSLANENHADMAFLKKFVEEHKEAVFPEEYFKDFLQPLEARVEMEVMTLQTSQRNHKALIRATRPQATNHHNLNFDFGYSVGEHIGDSQVLCV
eukprot:CAMPEP_0172786018 /NCGR_PEP_ID=MMETSP1074-20121228/205735_1 /TAXON_ID=2916 /ORGANISM="Ceratium fusus, Strain PA161109" /LENGTH=945 /DNA_ID=CAMNT_0013623031 /DNA_START=115 /DNA_END=2952 /DNA_ORIENTATION=+